MPTSPRWGRDRRAAEETGLGLTLLPVLYRFGNFGQAPSVHGQRRFVNDRDSYLRLIEASEAAIRPLPDARPRPRAAFAARRRAGGSGLARGLAPRHAPAHPCRRADARGRGFDRDHGTRPVALLTDTVALDARWCLIHATHLDDAERDAIAASGAVAGLCPITEASLGDGIFDGVRYRRSGRRLRRRQRFQHPDRRRLRIAPARIFAAPARPPPCIARRGRRSDWRRFVAGRRCRWRSGLRKGARRAHAGDEGGPRDTG